MLHLLFGVFIGAGLSLQTAINSRLRGFVGSPFLASTISFTVGTLFLTLVALASGQNLSISYQIFQSAPLWIWIGGLLGVIGLTTNILIFPHLGGVQTAIMPLLGQILMGLLIDHFGWFHSAVHLFGWSRFIGTLFVLMGIFLAVVLPNLHRNQRFTKTQRNIWFWRGLGVLAGTLTSMQTAINAELGRTLASSIQGAWVSFLVGAMTLILFVSLKERNGYQQVKQALGRDKPKWLFVGGVLGGIYVFGATLLAPILGTGQTVILALFGLICGSLFVDQFGLFGANRKPIVPLQIIGILILFAGVGFIRLI